MGAPTIETLWAAKGLSEFGNNPPDLGDSISALYGLVVITLETESQLKKARAAYSRGRNARNAAEN